MGGFLYVKHGDTQEQPVDRRRIEKALGAFHDKGLPFSTKIEQNNATIYVFNKLHVPSDNFLVLENGDFVVSTGTMIYRAQIGLPALKALYEDYDRANPRFDDFIGQFGVLMKKQDQWVVFNDYDGVYHLFANDSKTMISSSFLALARGAGPLSVCSNGLYEYFTLGTFHDGETLFNEVRQLDSAEVHLLDPDQETISKRVSVTLFQPDTPQEQALESISASTIDYYGSLKKVFGDSICQALSGGYDSRLMLAAARKVGIDPYLYVYGTDQNPDVVVAKQITRAEGLELAHTDRTNVPPVPLDDFRRISLENLHLLDGRGLLGIFDNGGEIATRHARAQATRLQLNGVGGEIYRNYWYVTGSRITTRAFLDFKFNTRDFDTFTEAYDPKIFLASMTEKIRRMAGADSHTLNRHQLEHVYPSMRLRFWMGQNNGANNFFCHAITPFAEARFTLPSSSIPLGYKDFGLFQSALINKIDPKLASYNSAYGHNFCDPLPLKPKLKHLSKMYFPLRLRPEWRKFKGGKSTIPYFLEREYIEAVTGTDCSDVSEFINLDEVKSGLLFNKALTAQMVFDYVKSEAVAESKIL